MAHGAHGTTSLSHRSAIIIVAIGLIVGFLFAGAFEARAHGQNLIYRSSLLSAHTSYGYGPYTAHHTNISCNGAAPYAAQIYNKNSVGTTLFMTRGNCPLSYGLAGSYNLNWWCGNRTGYTQPGVCYMTD